MGRRKLVRILLESGYTTDRDGNGSQNAATNIELLNLQHLNDFLVLLSLSNINRPFMLKV
jgi:hypothetical protein